MFAVDLDRPSSPLRAVAVDAVSDQDRPAVQLEVFEGMIFLRRVRMADEQLFFVVVVDRHGDCSCIEAGPDLIAESIGDVVELADANDIDLAERPGRLVRRRRILSVGHCA